MRQCARGRRRGARGLGGCDDSRDLPGGRFVRHLHLRAENELREPARDCRGELARQHRQHLSRRGLHQAQQRDHAALRVVIASEEGALGREPLQVVRQLSLQERHDVRAARAEHAEGVERHAVPSSVHPVDRCFSLAFPWLPLANYGRLNGYADAASQEPRRIFFDSARRSRRSRSSRRRRAAAGERAARAQWPRGTRAHAFRGLGKERPLHRFLVYAAAAAVASPVGVQVQVHPDDVHPQSLRGTRALARTAAARVLAPGGGRRGTGPGACHARAVAASHAAALCRAHPRVQLSPHRGNSPPRVGHRPGARAQAVGAQRLARGGGEPRAGAPRGLLRLARGSARAVSLRSPLGKVLGTGSAKQGTHHWWAQRLTSVALVPLSVWFVVSLLSLPSHDHATVVAWMGQSWTALLLVLLVLVGAWHSQLGLRVVVEDYVHGAPARTVTLVLLMFAHVLLAGAGVVAVLRVALGAAP